MPIVFLTNSTNKDYAHYSRSHLRYDTIYLYISERHSVTDYVLVATGGRAQSRTEAPLAILGSSGADKWPDGWVQNLLSGDSTMVREKPFLMISVSLNNSSLSC